MLLITFLSILSLLVSSCAVNQATYEQNVYKGLNMAATTYESTMETIGEAYKKGMISEPMKEKIIEKANIYWKTYHSAVLAYEIYLRQKTTDNKLKLDGLVQNMNNALVEFLEISQTNLDK
jgi:hypothetical protein